MSAQVQHQDPVYDPNSLLAGIINAFPYFDMSSKDMVLRTLLASDDLYDETPIAYALICYRLAVVDEWSPAENIFQAAYNKPINRRGTTVIRSKCDDYDTVLYLHPSNIHDLCAQYAPQLNHIRHVPGIKVEPPTTHIVSPPPANLFSPMLRNFMRSYKASSEDVDVDESEHTETASDEEGESANSIHSISDVE